MCHIFLCGYLTRYNAASPYCAFCIVSLQSSLLEATRSESGNGAELSPFVDRVSYSRHMESRLFKVLV